MEFKNWLENSKEITAAVVVMHEGKALILKRGSTAPWMPGKWNLPGGGVEQGEDIRKAAIRECIEETGIRPVAVRLLTVKTNPDYDVHFFVGQTDNPEVKLNFENTEYAWVSKADLSKYAFVPQVIFPLTAVLY